MSVWRNSSERDSCLGFLPLISLRPVRSYFKTCFRLDQHEHWRFDARFSRLESLRTIARALEHPWNKTLSLWGDFQQLPGVKAIESSGVMERAMGIEPTSEAWEASILPLYDARSAPNASKPARLLQEFFACKFVLECRVALGRMAWRTEICANSSRSWKKRANCGASPPKSIRCSKSRRLRTA